MNINLLIKNSKERVDVAMDFMREIVREVMKDTEMNIEVTNIMMTNIKGNIETKRNISKFLKSRKFLQIFYRTSASILMVLFDFGKLCFIKRIV